MDRHSETLETLGEAYARTGELDESALEAILADTGLVPDLRARALVLLGHAKLEDDRYEEGKAAYREAFNLTNDSEILVDLALLERDSGIDKALEMLAKVDTNILDNVDLYWVALLDTVRAAWDMDELERIVNKIPPSVRDLEIVEANIVLCRKLIAKVREWNAQL